MQSLWPRVLVQTDRREKISEDKTLTRYAESIGAPRVPRGRAGALVVL